MVQNSMSDKKIITKEKEGKKTREKNACPTRLEPWTFIPTLRFYHKATRALSAVQANFFLAKAQVETRKEGRKWGESKGAG